MSTLNWPNKGTVQDYVNNFAAYISTKTEKSEVYLVTTTTASKVELGKNELANMLVGATN